MLFYRAALPLSSRTLNYAAGLIRRHLKAAGSRWLLDVCHGHRGSLHCGPHSQVQPPLTLVRKLAAMEPGDQDRRFSKHKVPGRSSPPIGP